MPQDGIQRGEESFNSFLAGVLLTKKSINNFEFFNLMQTFESVYNVDVISDSSDLNVSIYLDDEKIKLKNSFSDIIFVDGKKVFVNDYLYGFTTPRVRNFFNIPDLEHLLVRKTNIISKPFIKILGKNKKNATI